MLTISISFNLNDILFLMSKSFTSPYYHRVVINNFRISTIKAETTSETESKKLKVVECKIKLSF